jgi:hypothetical protein
MTLTINGSILRILKLQTRCARSVCADLGPKWKWLKWNVWYQFKHSTILKRWGRYFRPRGWYLYNAINYNASYLWRPQYELGWVILAKNVTWYWQARRKESLPDNLSACNISWYFLKQRRRMRRFLNRRTPLLWESVSVSCSEELQHLTQHEKKTWIWTKDLYFHYSLAKTFQYILNMQFVLNTYIIVKGVTLYLYLHNEGVWENGDIAPPVLNLGNRWRWMAGFRHRLLYVWGKTSRRKFDRRLQGSQRRSGLCGEGRNLWHYQKSNPIPLSSNPQRDHYTELSRLQNIITLNEGYKLWSCFLRNILHLPSIPFI